MVGFTTWRDALARAGRTPKETGRRWLPAPAQCLAKALHSDRGDRGYHFRVVVIGRPAATAAPRKRAGRFEPQRRHDLRQAAIGIERVVPLVSRTRVIENSAATSLRLWPLNRRYRTASIISRSGLVSDK